MTTPKRERTDQPPVVMAQRLTKIFKDFWMRRKVAAVNQLDIEIRHGEIFGLIGPNGSGKSTTIKMILGLLHKTSGRLAVFSKTPENVAVKKRIGYLPEESYLYPFLNARETLDFYAKLFGLPRADRKRRIDELLEMVGLDAVQFRPIGEYSKGMQRRIGIAQALINDPEFLILDEPTSGLDPIGIRQVKDLILHLGKRGKTVLLSSHLLADVEDVCDYMVVLYGGRKQREGTREDLLITHDRTVIETDALSPEEIKAVRAFIKQKEDREVYDISPARQSLESLFLDIVEKAQQQHIETHGAKTGGETAAFLRGAGPVTSDDEGDQLLQKLTQIEEKPPTTQPSTAISDHPDLTTTPQTTARVTDSSRGNVDESILESLVTGSDENTDSDTTSEQSTEDATATSEFIAPSAKSKVDSSVLESLLDAYDENDTPAPPPDPSDDKPTDASQ